MKKVFLLLVAAFFATATMLADDISREQALQIASQFANSPSAQKLSRRSAPLHPVTPVVAHTMRSKVVAQKDNVYVINLGSDQGFVVVSGEDGADDVLLGYCDHGTFSYDNCPIQLKDLLASYSASVDSLRQAPRLAAMRRAATSYESYLGTVVVEPLIKTSWNQWAPYNQQCPVVTAEGTDLGAVYGGRYATGCVPTAIAQIMRYWRWPEVTSGAIKGQDFSGHTYDWDNMIDDYWYGYTETQANAVAKLMADIGKAMYTEYGQPNGSPTLFVPYALVENFGYSPDYEVVTGSSAYRVQDVLKEELDENRPVPYSGYPWSGDGHALICDGYTSNNYFHFNYGWGGASDGWYKLSFLPMFSQNVTVWKNFRPYDAVKKVVDGVEYGLLKNGTAEIISYVAGGVGKANGVLEIPATVEDHGLTYKVTRIRQKAFLTKGNFSKLVMGDNIETIDAIAFFNNKIDELVLSDKMEVVPDEAFQTCSIKKLTIGANVKRIGKRAFMLTNLSQGVISKSPAFIVDEEAFAYTKPSTEYDWLACITSLGRKAFCGSQLNVTNRLAVSFPNLEVIGDSAFVLGNTGSSARFFTIHSKVRQISPSAFDGWSSTSIMSVDDDNPYFSVDDQNNIYNKEKTSLLVSFRSVPSGVYPEKLVKLAPGCFRPNRAWNVIPSTVVEMTDAYRDCDVIENPFTCLAVVPPIIPDNFFEGKMDLEWAILLVPEGTEKAYLNAPGWRHFQPQWTWGDGITRGVIGNQKYTPLAAQEREYYMVVDQSGDKQRLSIPISEVSSMEISDDGQNVIINRNGKDAVTTTVAAVDGIKWVPGFVYENAEIFNLNAENLTADAQKCTVTFNATVIDEIDGDVQLCVRNAVLGPNALEGAVDGFSVDLSLSNGQHELTGTAKITVPVSVGAGKKLCASYYNEQSGEWEPVLFAYDKNSNTATIITNHLSTYGIFVIDEKLQNSVLAKLLVDYYAYWGLNNFNEASKLLLNILTSDNPNAQMVQEFKSNLQFYQSIGLDFMWNAVNGIAGPWGFDPYKLNKVSELLGYFGTALSILDVAAADIKGDDIGVAAGTLNTILGFTTGQMASAIGTSTMTAAMASVAFIGIALNKFGTAAMAKKMDYLRAAYRYYYSPAGYKACSPQSKYKKGSAYGMGKKDKFTHGYFYTLKDWYEYFYPVIVEGKMTEMQFSSYVESVLRLYCQRFWDDYSDATSWAYAYADKEYNLGYVADLKAEREKISNEYFAELMQVQMPAVFASIRETIATEAKNRAGKAAKDVADEVNTKFGLRIVDSQWKEGETSQYAGWKIGISEFPSTLNEKEYLLMKLNEKGRVNLGYFTEYAFMLNDMPTELTLYDLDDKPQKTYSFQFPEGKGKVVIDIDLATGGVKADKMPLEGLELMYDPNVVEYPYSFGDDDSSIGLLYLDNTINERARFQTAIEQFFNRHDFITVDKVGNFKIGDDIIGSFEDNGLESSGKFTVDVSHNFVEKTVSQFVSQLRNPSKGDIPWACGLLNGIIQHSIPCEYKITRKSVDSNEFEVSYTGKGDFALLARVAAHVDGVDQEVLVDASRSGGEGPEVTLDQITQQECSYDGKVTLKYSTTLKQYAQ